NRDFVALFGPRWNQLIHSRHLVRHDYGEALQGIGHAVHSLHIDESGTGARWNGHLHCVAIYLLERSLDAVESDAYHAGQVRPVEFHDVAVHTLRRAEGKYLRRLPRRQDHERLLA